MALRGALVAYLAVSALAAANYHGMVTFNGLPVPGATVTASREGKKFSAITDVRGVYSFPELAKGTWNIEVAMFGFAKSAQEVNVGPDAPAAKWELKLLSLDRIRAEVQLAAQRPIEQPKPQNTAEAPPEAPDVELGQRAADGFLINGSVNNGASSTFGQAPAFGNNRFGGKSLYNGGIGIIFDNSALNARPFSLTGQDTPKAAYSRVTGMLSFGGPLQIPRLFQDGPFVFLGYQWTRNRNATTTAALVPDEAQRSLIPQNRISAQALALLDLYPLPNVAGNPRYNYQAPILSAVHQDALQSRFNKALGSKNQVYGGFGFRSTRTDDPNLFGFLDTGSVLGIDTGINWTHRFNQRLFLNLGYRFNRLSTGVKPYFANRLNVSGLAGISGNDQDPLNWGPPRLNFSSGIASLSDAQSSSDRNQTSAVSHSMMWIRGAHNISFGADFRRQQFNSLAQQDPRGTFSFTGAATGSDFTGFLLGIPDTSSIAFGNADKYFRGSAYDAFFTDDWRIGPALTLNAGMRWEYGSPLTELYGRLVNLDIAPGNLRGFKRGFEPRVGIAWRPVPASSLVVRAGYGVYYDTSVYQAIASQMAQQPPLSKTLRIQNSAANPLTLANGFPASASAGGTFGVDPAFRPGYAQNWQLSVQRDLPASLQFTATYLGIKGTRGAQAFLPNTYPAGAANPCPACVTGFTYVKSNANSTREAGQVQLRRRLHSGFTATLDYTFSKSIDDAAVLGGRETGFAIAQNWLDLRAERGLSSFDQRHVLSLQGQYTTGMGLAGGTLLGGWKGALVKDWTFATQISAGSGLPQTPVYFSPVEGTGVTGTIRPDYTGAPLYAPPEGFFLNPAAYTAPQPGRWGNAGRNSITGPARFTLNASLARTFRLNDRFNLDLRLDSTNALNHVNFTAWNTTVNGAQFGLPAAANAMRSMQTTLRVRF